MSYRVRSVPRAEIDTQQIYDWIKERSADGARRWWIAFEEACGRLSRHPFSFALAPEARQLDREVRQIIFKTRNGRPYRVLFMVAGNEVRILRVRGPGQPELRGDEFD